MANIIDFIRENRIGYFRNGQISPVESLVLSQLSYFNYGKVESSILLKDLSSKFDLDKLVAHVWDPKSNKDLIEAIEKSDDWSKIKLIDRASIFDEKNEQQFTACTFEIKKGLYYMAYSGTNSSFAGWKEDFNLSFMDNIPSQISALAYAQRIIDTYPGKYYIGGHSKGGNLSHYTLFYIDNKYMDYIFRADNFDGPGFNIKEEGLINYEARKNKILKFIPENSIVGRIYEFDQDDTIIVKSSARIIFDHDPYTWLINKGIFEFADQNSTMSSFVQATLDSFNSSLDNEIKRDVLHSIYSITQAMDDDTFGQASLHWRKNLKLIISSFRKADKDTKEQWRYVAHIFRKSLLENRPRIIKR